MDVIWLTREPLPVADGGDKLYTLGLMKAATEQGARITAFATEAGLHTERRQEVDGVLWRVFPRARRSVIERVLSPLPNYAQTFTSRLLPVALARELADSPTSPVVIDSIAAGWLIKYIPASRDAPLIYLSHNHEASTRQYSSRALTGPLTMRLARRLDARRIAILEATLCSRASTITAITDTDAERFRTEHPKRTVITLSPGYDRPPLDPSRSHSQPDVLLVGTFFWEAKRQNLLRFLHAARPALEAGDFSLRIVGRMPPNFAGDLAAFPNVRVEGEVADISTALVQAWAGLVIDDIGGGFKMKTLDYIFGRVPVFATFKAVKGIGLSHGEHYLGYADFSRLVQGLQEWARRREELEIISNCALAYCTHHFRWDTSGQRLMTALAAKSPFA